MNLFNFPDVYFYFRSNVSAAAVSLRRSSQHKCSDNCLPPLVKSCIQGKKYQLYAERESASGYTA